MQGKAIANRGWLLAGVAAAVIAGAALPAAAADDDAAIQQKIEARLEKAGIARDGAVDVSVDNGSVMLTGAVTTVAAQNDASRLARKEARFVENRIRVIPAVERTDAELTKDVRGAILRYPRLTAFDSIELKVDGGNVLLAGSVLQPWHRRDIESAVERIPGVRSVENEIAVQGVSVFDARLRWQIYSRIYGHLGAVFPGAGDRTDAPVRIVVDQGRVTLTGWVPSAVDRTLVGNIARSTLAFSVDNQVKIDGEPPTTDQPKTTGPELVI